MIVILTMMMMMMIRFFFFLFYYCYTQILIIRKYSALLVAIIILLVRIYIKYIIILYIIIISGIRIPRSYYNPRGICVFGTALTRDQIQEGGSAVVRHGKRFRYVRRRRKKSDTDANRKPGKAPTKYAEESKDEPKQGRYGRIPEALKDRGGDGKEQEGNRFITDKDL